MHFLVDFNKEAEGKGRREDPQPSDNIPFFNRKVTVIHFDGETNRVRKFVRAQARTRKVKRGWKSRASSSRVATMERMTGKINSSTDICAAAEIIQKLGTDTLNLRGSISEPILQSLGSRYQGIHSVSLRENAGISANVLISLVEKCPAMTSLDMSAIYGGPM